MPQRLKSQNALIKNEKRENQVDFSSSTAIEALQGNTFIREGGPTSPLGHGASYLSKGHGCRGGGTRGCGGLGLHLGQCLLMDHQQLPTLTAHQHHPYMNPRRHQPLEFGLKRGNSCCQALGRSGILQFETVAPLMV